MDMTFTSAHTNVFFSFSVEVDQDDILIGWTTETESNSAGIDICPSSEKTVNRVMSSVYYYLLKVVDTAAVGITFQ